MLQYTYPNTFSNFLKRKIKTQSVLTKCVSILLKTENKNSTLVSKNFSKKKKKLKTVSHNKTSPNSFENYVYRSWNHNKVMHDRLDSIDESIWCKETKSIKCEWYKCWLYIQTFSFFVTLHKTTFIMNIPLGSNLLWGL